MNLESGFRKLWNNEEVKPYRVAVPASMLLTCITVLVTGGTLIDVIVPVLVVCPLVALIVGDTLVCNDIVQTPN